MSDDKVDLSGPQRALLDEIRKGDTTSEQGHRGLDTVTGKQVQSTHRTLERSDSASEGTQRNVRRKNQGTREAGSVVQGSNQGVGQTVSEGEPSRASLNRDSETSRQGANTHAEQRKSVSSLSTVTSSLSNADEERQKELNRQRQERYRTQQKQARTRDVTVTDSVTQSAPKFSLKNPFAKAGNTDSETGNDNNVKPKPASEVKLITKAEISELEIQLAYVYQHGSGILDDILEIVVKEHESVTIWQLDAEEAQLLAHMHLEQGRVSPQAAQSARKLIGLYDKIFLLGILAPRAVATGKHVVAKGGFSIK